MIHLRGASKTACGIDLITTDHLGQKQMAVDSVGDHRFPDYPVTCPGCLSWLAEFYPKVS